MKFKGKVHKVGDHINTDAIIPARFLVTSDPEALGKNCMSGLEPDWAKRVRKGDLLVCGRNFGCGSSREHAPIAIIGAGIPAVIAHSFARIFYRNAFNTGLPLLEIGDQIDQIDPGDELEVDTANGVIHNLSKKVDLACQPLPESISEILDAGGLVPYVRKRIASGKQA